MPREAEPADELPWDAIIFDCDGVLLESADIKTQAFADLFRKEPRRRAIVDYHLKNAGISRFQKFKVIYKRWLKRPLPPAEERRLGREFSRRVVGRVMACPFVPGLRRLLKVLTGRLPLFVVSGTPEGELRCILRGRGLAPSFKGVYGSPRTKEDLIRRILKGRRLDARRTLYVGDASNDRRAARAAGVDFLGRVPKGEHSPFPAGTATVRDMAGLAALLAPGRRKG